MEKIKRLFENINGLKAKYDIDRNKDRFNIITALHKERDEKNLHSRFISYLLSPTSGHDMGAVYLKLFISDVLKIEGFDISSITVLPNEANKSEYENIDILIVNDNNQAIIIENKIGAPNSNNSSYKDGYQGQLERYYTTINIGVNHQGEKTLKRKDIWVYYLSPEGRAPSNGDENGTDALGKLHTLPESWSKDHILSYEEHIRVWLTMCIMKTPQVKETVNVFIEHYLKQINKMTNNDITKNERLDLKNEVAKDIETARYLINNFKHVKWHTVHEFWAEVIKQLLENGYQNVVLYPDGKEFNEAITKITHKNKDINHGVLFDSKNGKRAYICGKGDLSWGVESPKTWKQFKADAINDINFSIFNSKCTYQLIDRKGMEYAIKEITDEIISEEACQFINLKPAL